MFIGTQGSSKAAAVVITAEAQHATTLGPDGTEHGAPVPHRVTKPEEEGLLAAKVVEERETNPLIACKDDLRPSIDRVTGWPEESR